MSVSIELETLLDEQTGIKVAIPKGWTRWTSEEFREQGEVDSASSRVLPTSHTSGGVYCFTPFELQVEQPTSALSILISPEAEGTKLNEFTALSLGQLELMFKSQGGASVVDSTEVA
jgi:hypothetical protein